MHLLYVIILDNFVDFQVLAKFPVIQHVLFGSLLPYKIAQQPQNVCGVRSGVMPRPPAGFLLPSTTQTSNNSAPK
jgi:Phosphotyrosyl phosphatase activator